MIRSPFRTLFLAASISISIPALAQDAPLQKPVSPPTPVLDNTDAVLKRATPNGSVRLGSVKLKRGVSITLHLEKDAQDLIERKDFAVKDAPFDLDKFRDFVLTKFGNAASFLASRAPDWPASEMNVLIADMGKDRQQLPTFFLRGSRVIVIDIWSWQDIQQRDLVFSETMPVHELTHFLQGFSAPQEPAYHRELAACVVEVVYLRHRIDELDPLFMNYLSLWGLPPAAQDVTDPERLADPEKFDHLILRHIAHNLVTRILRGTYKFMPPIAAKKTKKKTPDDEAKIKYAALIDTLEHFAIRYARHPQSGSEGFDATCREFGLRDAQNQPLTLDTLRRDVARDLTDAPPPAKPNDQPKK